MAQSVQFFLFLPRHLVKVQLQYNYLIINVITTANQKKQKATKRAYAVTCKISNETLKLRYKKQGCCTSRNDCIKVKINKIKINLHFNGTLINNTVFVYCD